MRHLLAAILLSCLPGAALADSGAVTGRVVLDVEGVPLEELLAQIEWPEEVRGAAVVVERLVLPPSAGEVPVDPDEAAAFAAGHPDREEVRIIAAARRPDESAPAGAAGSTYCAMRLRSRDDDFAVLEAPDLVPGLLDLLLSTLGPAAPAREE